MPGVLPDDSGDDNDDNQRHTITTAGHPSFTVVGHRSWATVGYGSEARQIVSIAVGGLQRVLAIYAPLAEIAWRRAAVFTPPIDCN
jgi:hypothetical protein